MRSMRMRFLCALAAAVLGVGGTLITPAAAEVTGCPDLTVSSGFGITGASISTLEQSDTYALCEVTMSSDAIFQPAGGTPAINPVTQQIKVRIYLPKGYDPDRASGYKSLYLLHGGAGNYDSWTTSGNLVSLLASMSPQPYDGIIVMPTGGLTGWYSDWAGRTDGFFAPKWETYHIAQLVPWIDANFDTIADRSGRALAGLSMGGFGALKYAAAHPDVFSAVGAFSPGIELRSGTAQHTISDTMWQAGAAINLIDTFNGVFKVNAYDENGIIVGDQTEQMLYRMDTLFGGHTMTYDVGGNPIYDWPSANPADFAEQGEYAPYSGKLALYAGGCAALPEDANGDPIYGTGHNVAPDECAYSTENTDEPGLGAYTSRLDVTLTAEGVSHRYCYGTGSHDWQYWKSDLVDFLQYAYGITPVTCNNA